MKVGSLVWGLARYLENHIFAEISLSPAPSNSKEVQHLLENFRRLGNLEFFKVARNRSGLSTYGSKIWLIYNPSENSTLLKPRLISHNNQLPSSFPHVDRLREKQSEISKRLSGLIALPRYSYIEEDREYLHGDTEIPFNHRLTREGLKYDHRYSILASRATHQFLELEIEAEEQIDPNDLRKNLRHNFQKFHKFDSVSITTSPETLGQWMRDKDYRPIANKVPITKFKGFYD
ncbi:hypothetical protein DFJ63DRAFT_337311 [Scheffersomyces coipomensis]|uniref:uncharacterized protein n=1 Tax=Scheffersomyces coipomensis TaxID=1788519 RepID=UPI00315DCD84